MVWGGGGGGVRGIHLRCAATDISSFIMILIPKYGVCACFSVQSCRHDLLT